MLQNFTHLLYTVHSEVGNLKLTQVTVASQSVGVGFDAQSLEG